MCITLTWNNINSVIQLYINLPQLSKCVQRRIIFNCVVFKLLIFVCVSFLQLRFDDLESCRFYNPLVYLSFLNGCLSNRIDTNVPQAYLLMATQFRYKFLGCAWYCSRNFLSGFYHIPSRHRKIMIWIAKKKKKLPF